eukprot:evm.model.scf_1725EXC.2 EVM.evm.TU.scf_1725EXC.2   scf_1725EXC:17751-21773(-)
MEQIDDKTINSVVVIMAMAAEAMPVVERLGLKKDDPPRLKPPAPCTSYSGEFSGLKVTVVHSGTCRTHGVDNIGTVAAGLTTYLALLEFSPDLVISAGTAGGFNAKGACIGDVFVSSACVNHDRRIEIPGFKEYGLGLTHSYSTANLRAALGLKSGVVSSGNSLDYTDKCMEIMKGSDAAVKEMEAAAVAWAAQLFQKPMFCAKSITDIVDGDRPAHEEFLENLQTAAAALQSTLPKILEFVSGKKLSQL